MVSKNSAVIYKNQPAVVIENDGEKYTIQFFTQGKKRETAVQKVREKDFALLSDVPVSSLAALHDFADGAMHSQIAETHEIVLSDEDTAVNQMSLREMAELVRGSFSADESWALFSALSASFEFALDDDAFKKGEIFFKARSFDEAALLRQKAYAKEHEAESRAEFVQRLKSKKLELPFDAQYMTEVESLALGKTSRSKIMAEAGFVQTPERAHKLLIETGIWDVTRNPFPVRYGFSMQSAAEGLASPPDENRLEVPETAYAIDNAWSADPDDAVSYDGKYLWVHIADPASSVLPDSSIDKTARDRGTTLYLPEGAVRMLAEKSLADYALGLNEKSNALSFRLEFDANGTVTDCAVYKTSVKVKRLTYEEADGQKDSPELSPFFEIARRNYERRQKAGAVAINLPEVHITVDAETKKVSVTPEVRYKSSDMVQEMMLLAGEGAARFAYKNRIPFPYVSQEMPDIPKDIPDGLAGEFKRLRGMRKRSVGITPALHAGIGVTFYSQVTSPLRRYGDLIAHEQLRAFLDGREMIDKDEMLVRISSGDAASVAARKASRDSELHWKLVYLIQNPEWTGEAVCVDIVKGKPSQFFIPSLAMQTYISGNFGLNEKIDVKASKIDVAFQSVAFSVIS